MMLADARMGDGGIGLAARSFWERCALVGMESMPPDSAASDADLMLAAWRDRFAPKEKS